MRKPLSVEDRARLEWRVRQCEDNLKNLIHAVDQETKAGNHTGAVEIQSLADEVKSLLDTIRADLEEPIKGDPP